MIRLVVDCVVNLGLALQRLDLNILWRWVLLDGASIFHYGDFVGGFCGSEVESGGLDSFQILSSSYIWLVFVYAMPIMIMS